MEILNIVSVFLTLLYLSDAPGEMKVPGSHGNALQKIPRAPERVYMELKQQLQYRTQTGQLPETSIT